MCVCVCVPIYNNTSSHFTAVFNVSFHCQTLQYRTAFPRQIHVSLSLFKRDAVYCRKEAYCRKETVYLGKRCCIVNFGTSLFYNTQHLFSTMTPHLSTMTPKYNNTTTTPHLSSLPLHCLFTAKSTSLFYNVAAHLQIPTTK